VDVRVGPDFIGIHDEDEVLISGRDGTIDPGRKQGYFCADSRYVSRYRFTLAGAPPLLLNSSAVTAYSARYEFTNRDGVTRSGDLEGHCLHLRVGRTIGGGVHEDLLVTNYSRQAVDVLLELDFQADFADLLEVRAGDPVRRGALWSWTEADGSAVVTRYQREEFERALHFEVPNGHYEYANGLITFPIKLDPHETWEQCVQWRPALDGAVRAPRRGCPRISGGETTLDGERRTFHRRIALSCSSDPGVENTFDRAVTDIAALRLSPRVPGNAGAGGWVPAAGVPWYLTLFGRDSLVVALQTLPLAPELARGALEALSRLQATSFDDDHDAQPGKIPHEIRCGELAHFHEIPQTPYYGTQDATSLFVWVAAELWRWQRDPSLMKALRPNVEEALRWIDESGDCDGDGLQEYKTRAKGWGYYNQGWKDAGDGIVDHDGNRPPLPIATCELQGYVVAAKRVWADVAEEAFDDAAWARRLRSQADTLAEQVESQFWWEEENTYYLGLDGDKRPIRSVASNAGHLLWTGTVAMDRARTVCERLLRDDLWSGWGVRTLSKSHPAYNPFSYQRGSVWPHDNAILAAGFLRYGLVEPAWQIARGLFDAAARFEHYRLPEVFAGLDRDAGSFPVQYLGANVPQAWASGAVLQLLCELLGVTAPARQGPPSARPALPSWLGRISLSGVVVGATEYTVEAQGSDLIAVKAWSASPTAHVSA
jgi:glycogen debranching enzyme